jgi:hypothetical protein
MTDAALTQEIARNFDYLQRNLATYLPLQRDRYALLKAGSIIDFFDTAGDADDAGATKFADNLYSIQQVTNEPVELGLYANAPD